LLQAYYNLKSTFSYSFYDSYTRERRLTNQGEVKAMGCAAPEAARTITAPSSWI
jgi:hypothetical protein